MLIWSIRGMFWGVHTRSESGLNLGWNSHVYNYVVFESIPFCSCLPEGHFGLVVIDECAQV